MHKETAKWVRKAEADFRVAEVCAELKPSYPLHTCYHCQQCAEKYLQALLVEWNKPGPRVHDLEKLLDLVVVHEPSLANMRKGLLLLTRFADDEGFPIESATTRESQSALLWAVRVRGDIRKRLNLQP